MARLVVVTSPGLSEGFRLAGCATVVARSADSAQGVLRSLMARGDVGLVLVSADLWEGLDGRLRADMERVATPVVMPVPAGERAMDGRRTQLIAEMLQRAIGFRIELTGTGEPGGLP